MGDDARGGIVVGARAEDGLSAREIRLVRFIMGLFDDAHGDDVVEGMGRLVHALTDLVPAAAAALLALDEQQRLGLVACTDESARHLELYQLQTNDGPCIAAVRTGRRVVVPDLASAGRWPKFCAGAAARGFTSVLAVPMRAGPAVVGCVNVFFRSGGVSDSATSTSQVLVDAAALAVTAQRRLTRATTLADQLHHALRSRVAIEQAKGMVAEHAGLSTEEAFGLLRSYARSRQMKLASAAEAVAARALPPAAVVSGATDSLDEGPAQQRPHQPRSRHSSS